MITFQDKIEMCQGLRRYDPVTGEAVPVAGQRLKELTQCGCIVEDTSVETPIQGETPSAPE